MNNERIRTIVKTYHAHRNAQHLAVDLLDNGDLMLRADPADMSQTDIDALFGMVQRYYPAVRDAGN